MRENSKPQPHWILFLVYFIQKTWRLFLALKMRKPVSSRKAYIAKQRGF